LKELFLSVILISAVLISCSSAPQPAGVTGSVTLSDEGITDNELTGKEWQLIEVRINGVNNGFNRNDLTRIGLTAEEGFSLSFDADTINGIGAPNRYIAKYSRTSNQISFSLIVATKMAAIFELDKLKEQEYFNYLQNADSWKIVNKNLELYSKTADGKAVILIFNPTYSEQSTTPL
jgi:heat shock protein HslJ